MSIDSNFVYLAQLNEGDVALELGARGSIVQAFGSTFGTNETVVYDRMTGSEEGSIPNQLDVLGRPAFPNLYNSSHMLFQTYAGCCGSGILFTTLRASH